MPVRVTATRVLVALAVPPAVLVAALVAWVVLTTPSFAHLRREGNKLVGAVERYREQNGRYPASLEEVGVTPPETRYGPWRYECWEGRYFSLSVGDYGRDGFVYSYSSAYGTWYADT
jgi:hypothetical protein